MTETQTGLQLPDLGQLPDSARVWIYGVERELTPDEESEFLRQVDSFLSGWKAHGHPLAAAREWRLGRFLIVAVDEAVEPPSGCSIDAFVRILRGLEGELGLRLLGSGDIWMRTEEGSGEIQRVTRSEFRERASRGEVTSRTTVFDLSLTRLGEVRAGRWELPAGESWHSRYLG